MSPIARSAILSDLASSPRGLGLLAGAIEQVEMCELVLGNGLMGSSFRRRLVWFLRRTLGFRSAGEFWRVATNPVDDSKQKEHTPQ